MQSLNNKELDLFSLTVHAKIFCASVLAPYLFDIYIRDLFFGEVELDAANYFGICDSSILS